jgi:glucose-1-phosphate thymidylyltransferase
MRALILAAGYGTRLAVVAKNTPKPLLDVAGKPLIDYTVEKLKPVKGLSEIVVVTNNKYYDHFCQWAKTHPDFAVRIVNDGSNTPEERLGSVGDIDFVWKQTKNTPDDWLVVGGDNIFEQDLNQFMDVARTKAPATTIGVFDIKNIEEATKFGVSALDASGKVTSFEEKPEKPKSSLIVMCLYYFPKQTLGFIDEYRKEAASLDTAGSYIKWLAEKKNVYGFQFGGKWYDIGSVESLREAQTHFNPA